MDQKDQRDQSHQFEVGGRYRNNLGEYEVLAVEGDKMTVRFDDGRTQDLSIATQARILFRYQEEEARRNAPPAVKATKRRSRSTKTAKTAKRPTRAAPAEPTS